MKGMGTPKQVPKGTPLPNLMKPMVGAPPRTKGGKKT
jgi:hypothetical protein